MIALIFISPILFLVCYALPLLATFLSRDQPDKWVAFWLLQIVSAWTLIPFLGLFFESEILMIFKIIVALALYFLLNREKVPWLLRRYPRSTLVWNQLWAWSSSRRTMPPNACQALPNNTDWSNDLPNCNAQNFPLYMIENLIGEIVAVNLVS